MIFIGIDVHLHSLVIAVINEKLKILEVRELNIDEVIPKVLFYKPNIIAVDAPYNLNFGLMNNEEYRKKLAGKINGHYNKKVSEYELSRRAINPFSTPDSIDKTFDRNDLKWMNTGFGLFKKLKELGFNLLNEENCDEKKNRGLIEVFPHASFTTLAEYILSKKSTEVGLTERCNILEKIGLDGIQDIINNTKKKDKDDYLDALVAAYTAFKIYNGEGTFVGDKMEGQIALPTGNLKDLYKRLKKLVVKEKTTNAVNIDIIDLGSEFEYEYKNVDSVIWLKYFKSINNAPDISILLDLMNNNDITIPVTIFNSNNHSIEVILQPIKNSIYGLKPLKEFKEVMKEFWGSHGNNEHYKIIIRRYLG